MKRHVTISAAIAIAAVAGLAACSAQPSASPSATTGGTFTVDMIVGQTGPLAAAAADFSLGMQTAADGINKAGGIQGKKVVVKILDDKSDPTQAVTQLQTLINSGTKPDLVYAGISSSETLAMLPILTQNKILSISQATAAAINVPATYPYHFGVSPTNAEGLAVIGATIKSKKYKKVALIVSNDANGADLTTTVTTDATQNGAKVVDTEQYDPNGVDYTVQFQRALAAKPDVIFTDGSGPAIAGRLFSARATAGATSIPLIGGGGISGLALNTIASADAIKNCSIPVFSFLIQGGDTAEAALLKPLAAATKASGQTGTIYGPGIGFDAMRIVALAGKTAKSTSGADMAKVLGKLSTPKGYSVQYPDGFSYSSSTHFPTVSGTTGGKTLISCNTTVIDKTYIQVQ
ncbi:MAG: ABC transporter substrate-binding protein [Actinomycetota bacterium]